MLSVIVPIYNVERYLKECLESLHRQKIANVEFLLIDDGSVDNSSKIARDYLKIDKRFKYFYKQNGGLSDARNYGVKKSSGDYIFFLDSDDYIEDNSLELIIDKINQGYDCICFDVVFFWDDSGKIKRQNGYLEEKNFIKGALLASPSACNKIFKKEAILKYPFPIGIYYEDLATIPLLMLEVKNGTYIEKPIYKYRQRSNSIIYSRNEKTNDIYNCLKIVVDGYRSSNKFDEYYSIIEYLFIEHLLLNGNRRFLYEDDFHIRFKKSRDFIDQYFANPLKNKYYKKMSLNDKVFVCLSYLCCPKAIRVLIKLKETIRKS